MWDLPTSSHWIERHKQYPAWMRTMLPFCMSRLTIAALAVMTMFVCVILLIRVHSDARENWAELEDEDSSFEEVDMSELEEPLPKGRTLPPGYIWTLELYRNRIRYMKGDDERLLTMEDFREGYGRFKIPYKEEIQEMLQSYEDKR